MSWAKKRKSTYLGGLLVFFLLVIVLPAIIYFYKAPTCFDGKKNQDEIAVDCGGICNLLCPTQYVPLNIIWSRFTKVSDGVYNVMAYIENPNINASTNKLDYVFKLYDKNGIVLRERAGQTVAPANKIMAVFEPEMITGNQIPQWVEFYFSSPATWTKQDSLETGLSVSQSTMSKENTAPRLNFVLTNKTINQIKEIEAIAIIYNSKGNTIAFSRTIVKLLAGKETREVNFNWPKPFSEPSARTEIVLKVLK